MVTQGQADTASAFTVMFSAVSGWLYAVNGWVSEFMPMFTAFGIISGTALTAWYYWQLIQQRRRDRAVQHERIDLDKKIHGIEDDETN